MFCITLKLTSHCGLFYPKKTDKGCLTRLMLVFLAFIWERKYTASYWGTTGGQEWEQTFSSWYRECHVCVLHVMWGGKSYHLLLPYQCQNPLVRLELCTPTIKDNQRKQICHHVCGLFDQVVGSFCRFRSVSYWYLQSSSWTHCATSWSSHRVTLWQRKSLSFRADDQDLQVVVDWQA